MATLGRNETGENVTSMFALETNEGDHHLQNLVLIHKNTSYFIQRYFIVNPLKPELNPICYLLALLGAHHFLHVSRIRVKLLTFRLLMSYIYIWSTHS